MVWVIECKKITRKLRENYMIGWMKKGVVSVHQVLQWTCLNKVICPKQMIYNNLNQNGAYDKARSGKKMWIEKIKKWVRKSFRRVAKSKSGLKNEKMNAKRKTKM